MALPREEVSTGMFEELGRFEELMRSLDEKQWTTPTRCEDWTVADICSHVTGTMSAIAEGRTAELTLPNGTQIEADKRRGRSANEVADELHGSVKVLGDIAAAIDDTVWAGPPIVDLPGTFGDTVQALWYDAYIHIDDIGTAIGRPSLRGPGLRASVEHLAVLLSQEGWGPATLALEGLEEFAVGDGSGERVTGDPLTFVLAATGRGDPAALGLDATVNVYKE